MELATKMKDNHYKWLSYKFHCVLVFVLVYPFSILAHNNNKNFLQCLSQHLNDDELIYTPNDPSYLTVLNISIQNQRFATPFAPKPLAIITPTKVSHVQASVICSKNHGIEIRTRSGGHDFEGLSYVAFNRAPFVVIDLVNLRSIEIDVRDRTAWVQAGATIGEVAYRIAEKSKNLGFPAGICHTVGVGGHFGGGGWGMMMRKYGLSADNIVDAEIINVDGIILDRRAMGEDLFWAIRGGGAASFGVVLSWKIRLVHVPSIVTLLNVTKVSEKKETMKLVYRWQSIANKIDRDLTIIFNARTVNTSTMNNTSVVEVVFGGLFLGGAESLLRLARASFPELGLERDDCTEMRWIDSVLFFAGFPIGQSSPEALANRTPQYPLARFPFKGKLDYVTEIIPKKALEILFKRLNEVDLGMALFQFVPHGGKMNEISEGDIPYPHRSGNLYHIFYVINWETEENYEGQYYKQLSWIRSVYDYMTPYVSKNPRSAYINYRDLDIGKGSTSYEEASIWGFKYFKRNFRRLVDVKTKVDPTNFFRNDQSIPPFSIDQCTKSDP